MNTADVAAEVKCLRRLIGMRCSNVYDLNPKVLPPFSFFLFPFSFSYFPQFNSISSFSCADLRVQADEQQWSLGIGWEREGSAADGKWREIAHYSLHARQEQHSFWFHSQIEEAHSDQKARGCAPTWVRSGIVNPPSLYHPSPFIYFHKEKSKYHVNVFMKIMTDCSLSIWTWGECKLCYIGVVCSREHPPHRF